MVRLLRFEVENAWHHVTAHGNERRDTFRDDEDRHRHSNSCMLRCDPFSVLQTAAKLAEYAGAGLAALSNSLANGFTLDVILHYEAYRVEPNGLFTRVPSLDGDITERVDVADGGNDDVFFVKPIIDFGPQTMQNSVDAAVARARQKLKDKNQEALKQSRGKPCMPFFLLN